MSPADDDAGGPVRHRSRRRHRRATTAWIWAIAVASGVAAALSPARPVGLRPADVAWCAVLGVAVPLVASRSRRLALAWSAVVAVPLGAFGDPVAQLASVALLALVVLMARSTRRDRVQTAAAGALALQCLLRAPSFGVIGLPTLLALVALAPVAVSGFRAARTKERRIALALVGVTVVGVVVLGATAAVSVLGSRGALDRGADRATAGLDRVRDGNSSAADAEFRSAADAFDEASASLEGWQTSGARLLPVIGQHVEAVRRVASAGAELSRSAAVTTSTADYRSLTADAGQVDLARVIALQQPVESSAATIAAALDSVGEVASPWLLPPVADELTRFTTKLSEIDRQATIAAEGLRIAPALLGGAGPKRYLVSFGTTGETREGGGFVGSYGLLEAADGRLRLVDAGNLNDLNPPITTPYALDPPPDWQERYGPYYVDRFLGNHAASPDWPTDRGVIGQLFPQAPAGTRIDGALYIDTAAVAALLELSGPVTVPGIGRTIDAGNVEQYLLVDQYLDFDPLNPQRKDVLGDVARATFDALTSRALPGISTLGDRFGPLVAAGHLRMSVTDAPAEAFFDDVGLSGSWPEGAGTDVLSVRSANNLQNKIDSFIRRDIAVATTIADDGALTQTVTVTVHNDAPSTGLPTYVIGNTDGLPEGTSRDLVALHSPHRLTGVTIDGREEGWLPQTEFGGPVYTAVAQVPPGGSTTLVFTLEGTAVSPYRLEVVPQPMRTADQLALRVDHDGGSTELSGALDHTVVVDVGTVGSSDGRVRANIVIGVLITLAAMAVVVVLVRRRRYGV